MNPWPADIVERRPLAILAPHPKNSRTHSDDQIAQIAASIREFGFTVPVIVDENDTIIAGHGRVLAAQRLDYETIPVVVARGWSDAKKRAYIIADNKLTLNGGWNEEQLKIEFTELARADFDLDLTGFSPNEIALVLDGPTVETGGDEGDGEGDGSGSGMIKIKLKVAPGDETEAREVIENALQEAGIDYEF